MREANGGIALAIVVVPRADIPIFLPDGITMIEPLPVGYHGAFLSASDS